MFDFEKLVVYQKAKAFNRAIISWLRNSRKIDAITSRQLRRAALSVPLNIAEGSGRFTRPDRRNFYVIARSSVFECVSILDILKDENTIEEQLFNQFYESADELSRILFSMVKKLEG